MNRREFLKAVASSSLALGFAYRAKGNPMREDHVRLFPTDLPGPDWATFPAAGFSHPACGVVYRLKDKVTNGMALGGIDTGCIDPRLLHDLQHSCASARAAKRPHSRPDR
jgi:hypothetical protein